MSKMSKDQAMGACTMMGTGGPGEACCSLGGGGAHDHGKEGTTPLSTGLGTPAQNPRSVVTMVEESMIETMLEEIVARTFMSIEARAVILEMVDRVVQNVEDDIRAARIRRAQLRRDGWMSRRMVMDLLMDMVDVVVEGTTEVRRHRKRKRLGNDQIQSKEIEST